MENFNGTGRLVGALAGAALGILFAPEKGSRTRSNFMDGAKDLVGDMKRKMKNEAAELRKKAEDLEEQAKDKLEEVINNVKHKTAEAANNHK